jgi:hypothetical protein
MQAINETTGRRGIERRIYDSFTELASEAQRSPWRETNSNPGRDSKWVGRKFADWAAVDAAAPRVWPEGLEIVERLIAELGDVALPQPISRRRRARWDEATGDELDLDRLRAGQEYWRRTVRQATRGPANLTLVASVTTPASRTPQEVLWRAVAGIVLAERLEAAGYRVELWAANVCDNAFRDSTGLHVGCCLKQTSDPLDMATLTSAVSGWAYRTLWFCEMGRSHTGRQPNFGLGQCRTLVATDVAAMTHDAAAVVIDQLWDRTAAVKFIREQLAKFS